VTSCSGQCRAFLGESSGLLQGHGGSKSSRGVLAAGRECPCLGACHARALRPGHEPSAVREVHWLAETRARGLGRVFPTRGRSAPLDRTTAACFAALRPRASRGSPGGPSSAGARPTARRNPPSRGLSSDCRRDLPCSSDCRGGGSAPHLQPRRQEILGTRRGPAPTGRPSTISCSSYETEERRRVASLPSSPYSRLTGLTRYFDFRPYHKDACGAMQAARPARADQAKERDRGFRALQPRPLRPLGLRGIDES